MFSAGVAQAKPETIHLARLLDPIGAELARVEVALGEQSRDFDVGIRAHVEYVLSGTGKRLRPSLALLAGGATGGIAAGHVTLGVIVELIHAATLVHDDVLDEAQLRHGLPTSNARWGNEISVLLGDCLFAHALKLAASFPTTDVCRSVSDATNTVCAGEILQTQRRFDLALSREQYLAIIGMKTGALFAVSCELGARLNGATPAVAAALCEFGNHLGVAYQIYDDCVDIFGQERKAGKSLGTDMETGKLTLPFILLLQHVGADRRAAVANAIFRGSPGEREELRALVMRNGVVTESLATITQHIGAAEACLEQLSSNVFTETLSNLATYLSGQSQRLLQAAVAA